MTGMIRSRLGGPNWTERGERTMLNPRSCGAICLPALRYRDDGHAWDPQGRQKARSSSSWALAQVRSQVFRAAWHLV